jgi:hypothetical protein
MSTLGNAIVGFMWMCLPRSVFLVSIVLAVTGCAIVPITGQRSLPVVEPLAVEGPTATLVVLREKKFCGSFPLHYVVIDDRPIAALKTGQHTAFQLSPGSHTLNIQHHTIKGFKMPKQPIIPQLAIIPDEVISGRFGKAVTQNFSTEKTYYFLITSKCFPWDENNRITIEQVERWPEGITLDPREFVKPGSRLPDQSMEPTE